MSDTSLHTPGGSDIDDNISPANILPQQQHQQQQQPSARNKLLTVSSTRTARSTARPCTLTAQQQHQQQHTETALVMHATLQPVPQLPRHAPAPQALPAQDK